MKLSRDAWLTIGLLTVLALVTTLAGIQQTQQQLPPLASDSNAPDGARALWLWLETLGYHPSAELQTEFAIPESTRAAFILQPTNLITEEEWQLVDEWVEGGGTLLVAGDTVFMGLAAEHYDFALAFRAEKVETLTLQNPLFNSPSLTAPATVQTSAYFQSNRSKFVTYLAVAEGPVILSFHHGAGMVFLSAASFPFTNAGLKESGNPALTLNLVSVSLPGPVWFDEWHHGRRLADPQLAGPTDWLMFTPAGRALLFVGIVLFLALVFGGQRFGRPVPLLKDAVRRAPLEYITAIANLNRRAGHRAEVLKHYSYHLKRSLGLRYRLAASLPDHQYARQLAAFNPNVDEVALLELLTRLSRRNVSENEMIRLAAEVARWTKGL